MLITQSERRKYYLGGWTMKITCVRITKQFDHPVGTLAAEQAMTQSELVCAALQEKVVPLEQPDYSELDESDIESGTEPTSSWPDLDESDIERD
jgi:hypothetical protein